jgi:hypothetical protein
MSVSGQKVALGATPNIILLARARERLVLDQEHQEFRRLGSA